MPIKQAAMAILFVISIGVLGVVFYKLYTSKTGSELRFKNVEATVDNCVNKE
jgi:hypothetical protein